MSVALGVNYGNVGTASYEHALAQLRPVRAFTDMVRVHLPDYQTQASIDTDLQIIQAAVALGFTKIVWGISSNRYNIASNAITQRNWPTFRQKIIDYAAIAQAAGVTHYQCGNEEELHIYIVPTSMARSSNVVTAVLPFSPDYQVGDTIYVEDATPSTFNGTFTLTGVNGATLTWAQTAANVSATSSKVTDFLKSNLRTNLRGVVASVKAVFNGAVSTAISQDDYAGWVSDANMGSFDFLTYQPYGENVLGTVIDRTTALTATYPGKIKITEFGVHSSWSLAQAKGLSISKRGFDNAYADVIAERLAVFNSLSIDEAYLFAWQTSTDDFAVKLQSGGFRQAMRSFKRMRLADAVVDY